MSQLIGMVEEKKKITAAIKNHIPALLIGETGTGKTSLAKEAAQDLGLHIVRVNLDGGVTPDEIIGRYQAKAENGTTVTYFQEGIIPRAMRDGAVLILDEINAALPDTLFCLHALMEENPRLFIPETQEEITPKDSFTIIATMNPSHDYAGTKGLNAALYSRFGMVIRFKKLKGGDFLKALNSHVPGLTAGKAERICSIVEECDQLRDAEKINTRLTLREAISAARFAMDGLTLQEAITAAMLDKLESFEREQVKTGFKETVYTDQETIEDIFFNAANAKGFQADNIELREKVGKLEGIMEKISGGMVKISLKKLLAEAGSVKSEAGEEIAWNPEEVKPWAKVKK